MLVPETLICECLLIRILIYFFEYVFESSIVLLQYSVLSTQIEGVGSVEGVLETGVGELLYGLVCVVHTEKDTFVGEVEDVKACLRRTIFRDEFYLELARFIDNKVSSFILVSKCVSPNDDGLIPPRYKLRYVRDDDGLTEHGPI